MQVFEGHVRHGIGLETDGFGVWRGLRTLGSIRMSSGRRFNIFVILIRRLQTTFITKSLQPSIDSDYYVPKQGSTGMLAYSYELFLKDPCTFG